MVLYEGERDADAVQKLRISDSFEDRSVREEFEWTATVYNLCHKENRWLLDRCRILKEYTEFNERVRKYKKVMPIKKAVDLAVEECIEEGILAEFLKKHRAEVRMSAITEFNQEVYDRSLRQEGREEGIEKSFKLMALLHRDGRQDLADKIITDIELRKKLFEEYQL